MMLNMMYDKSLSVVTTDNTIKTAVQIKQEQVEHQRQMEIKQERLETLQSEPLAASFTTPPPRPAPGIHPLLAPVNNVNMGFDTPDTEDEPFNAYSQPYSQQDPALSSPSVNDLQNILHNVRRPSLEFDRPPPGFDRYPSGAGRLPLGFDRQPPVFDRQPPGYDRNPPGHGRTQQGPDRLALGYDGPHLIHDGYVQPPPPFDPRVSPRSEDIDTFLALARSNPADRESSMFRKVDPRRGPSVAHQFDHRESSVHRNVDITLEEPSPGYSPLGNRRSLSSAPVSRHVSGPPAPRGPLPDAGDLFSDRRGDVFNDPRDDKRHVQELTEVMQVQEERRTVSLRRVRD